MRRRSSAKTSLVTKSTDSNVPTRSAFPSTLSAMVAMIVEVRNYSLHLNHSLQNVSFQIAAMKTICPFASPNRESAIQASIDVQTGIV
jgi:hypothetical protein